MRIGKKKLAFDNYKVLWIKKQGPAIFLSLSGQLREAILNSNNGVENILAKLDTLYLKDVLCSAFEFESLNLRNYIQKLKILTCHYLMEL